MLHKHRVVHPIQTMTHTHMSAPLGTESGRQPRGRQTRYQRRHARKRERAGLELTVPARTRRRRRSADQVEDLGQLSEGEAGQGEVALAEHEGPFDLEPSKEYIQDLVDRFGPHFLSSDPSVNPNSKPTHIKQVVWSSRILNRSLLADTTFVRMGCKGESGEGGAVLLIGDAAHSHSPAGGQGLALGLHDAISIGEALMKHHDATKTHPLSEADLILRHYATARRAHALKVIKFVKGVANLETLDHRERMFWWLPVDSQTFVDGLFWVIGHLPFVRRHIAWELCGLGAR